MGAIFSVCTLLIVVRVIIRLKVHTKFLVDSYRAILAVTSLFIIPFSSEVGTPTFVVRGVHYDGDKKPKDFALKTKMLDDLQWAIFSYRSSVGCCWSGSASLHSATSLPAVDEDGGLSIWSSC